MIKIISTFIIGSLLQASCGGASDPSSGTGEPILATTTTEAAVSTTTAARLAEADSEFPMVFHTEDNQIIAENGEEVVPRGVNALDPIAQATFGEPSMGVWEKDYYAVMAEWGVELVRIPVHPELWREDPAQALDILDQTVQWIGELGMYAIIDYHSIGMVTTGDFEEPIYETTPELMKEFWQVVSAHFADNDVVAIYELFNEPVNLSRVASDGRDNAEDWHDWKLLAEELIDVIRAEDASSVVIVGGMYWSSDLSYVNADPVDRADVVYAVHPYPGATDNRPWQEAFGDTAENYRVIATEIRFTSEKARATVLATFPEVSAEGDTDAYNPVYLETSYTDGLYRDDIMAFFNERSIGWTAWSFSPIWGPTLLSNWDYEASEAGAWIIEQLGGGEDPS